jgi:hypothetical protein
MSKKVVQYSAIHSPIHVGLSVTLTPVDHPDTYNVTNGMPAYTSDVVSYDETTGFIETKYTLYVPEGAVGVDA